MSNLLKRDKQAFEEYAIQGAIITLIIRSLWKDLTWALNKLGIPLAP